MPEPITTSNDAVIVIQHDAQQTWACSWQALV
jgi:hypothetical protein